GGNRGAERHALGRVFRLLEREVGAGGQQPRQEQPQQQAAVELERGGEVGAGGERPRQEQPQQQLAIELERRRREAAVTRRSVLAVASLCVWLAVEPHIIGAQGTAQ